MTITTRFAPSPTGRLHLGHALSAVLAHDLARSRGGRFLLRIEDIDPVRSREEHVTGIEQDLAWLGIRWDDVAVRQSARLDRYAEGLAQLKARSLVYPCFCTRAEIAASAAAPHGPDAAIYPGTCRALPATERARRSASEPHCWRLDSAAAVRATGPLWWCDREAGTVQADMLRHGDVVLARKDAPTSYHLAVTVDDAAQGITHVVRGRDLFEATHVHRLLQALLGLPTPHYSHHELLLGADGRRLAKRNGAKSLAELRAQGVDPAALVDRLRSRRPVSPIGQ